MPGRQRKRKLVTAKANARRATGFVHGVTSTWLPTVSELGNTGSLGWDVCLAPPFLDTSGAVICQSERMLSVYGYFTCSAVSLSLSLICPPALAFDLRLCSNHAIWVIRLLMGAGKGMPPPGARRDHDQCVSGRWGWPWTTDPTAAAGDQMLLKAMPCTA
jgi:hypothetical protein